MSSPDTSSAEWIAESPAAQATAGGYQLLPLANLGEVAFSNATTTTAGYTGSISDAHWSATRVELSSAAVAGVPVGARGVT